MANQNAPDEALYQRIQKTLADPGAPAVFNADWWVKRITELVAAETAAVVTERDALARKVDDYQSRLAMIRVEAKDQTLRTPFVEAVDRIVGFEAFAALAFRDAKTLAKGRVEGLAMYAKHLSDMGYKGTEEIVEQLAAQAGEGSDAD